MENVKEIRISENGKVEKVMQWPVAENPDKSWGNRGYERDSNKNFTQLNALKAYQG